jgi:hypothetical protein
VLRDESEHDNLRDDHENPARDVSGIVNAELLNEGIRQMLASRVDVVASLPWSAGAGMWFSLGLALRVRGWGDGVEGHIQCPCAFMCVHECVKYRLRG